MSERTDILFVTHMEMPRDTGDPRAYQPLRFQTAGQTATIPWLRALAAGEEPATALKNLAARRAAYGLPPVLTPFYIQSYMERRGLRCVEVPCLEIGMDQLRARLADGVNVVALSTSWLGAVGGAESVRRAAEQIRALSPDVTIVVGGVGVRKGLRVRSLLQDGWFGDLPREELARLYLLVDATKDAAIDAIVFSEGGEATLAEIAQRVRDGREFRSLPNLALPDGAEYRFNDATGETSEVDHESVDWSRYAERLRYFEAPIRTALGCPFRCEFCDFFGLYQSRVRTLDSLMAELRTVPVSAGGRRRAFFADDNVAIHRKRLVELTRAIIAENLKLSWRAFIRADVIDAEVADLLRDSGCEECLLGVESGDPRILRNMRKQLDPDRASRAVELLDSRGICTQSTFVVGFPGEDAESLSRTAALLSSYPSGKNARAVHRYYLFPFLVVPLCPVAGPDRRAEYKLEGLGDRWRHCTMTSDEANQALKEVFVHVRGPSHVYLEPRPPEWPLHAVRQILESRDALQKDLLSGRPADAGVLLDAVRQADLPFRKPA